MALTAAEHSPYQGPRPSLPRPSGRLRLQRTVYSTTANKPCTKERKKASRRGREERRVEGRSAFLSLHALEGCRLWLRNGGMKAGLSPCRHAGIGWIMLSQRDRRVSGSITLSQTKVLIDQKVFQYTWIYCTKAISIVGMKTLR
ncbi:Oxysterol-binding protein 11 [Dissostichus eleginoides]|uniref:Oxysterol-binding protein 11 n=1 Tax=Dissostichus eleginoides TaxID=100907 RepID=A0AAD9CPM1_DISEL|nr:Oxysterol-binding protein 11 [Dissostichus eleginoides]